MARYPVRHARNGLDLEHGLWLGTERDCRFKRVLDAMVAEELEKIGRVLVYNDVGVGDVNSKSIWEEFFLFLGGTNVRDTLSL